MMNRLRPLIEAIGSADRETRVKWGYAVAALLVTAALWSQIDGRIDDLSRKRETREKGLVELMLLKQRYLAAKAAAGRLGSRAAGGDSAARIVEETGISGKSLQVRGIKGDNPAEELSEIRIEGITSNEAVNLLYRLERGNRPVSVRKVSLKTRFDDPSRIDATLVVAVPRAGGQGGA